MKNKEKNGSGCENRYTDVRPQFQFRLDGFSFVFTVKCLAWAAECLNTLRIAGLKHDADDGADRDKCHEGDKNSGDNRISKFLLFGAEKFDDEKIVQHDIIPDQIYFRQGGVYHITTKNTTLFMSVLKLVNEIMFAADIFIGKQCVDIVGV